jgi:hypothetical protein
MCSNDALVLPFLYFFSALSVRTNLMITMQIITLQYLMTNRFEDV